MSSEITEAERLEWCIQRLWRDPDKFNAYLTTDVGCGCCGDGVVVKLGVSAREAIDAQILMDGRREPAKTRAERLAALQAEIAQLLEADSDGGECD